MSYLDRRDPAHPEFKQPPPQRACIVCVYCAHTPGQRCPDCGTLWV